MIVDFENWIDDNLPFQHDKTVLITGANSGIDYYAALALAKVEADVSLRGVTLIG